MNGALTSELEIDVQIVKAQCEALAHKLDATLRQLDELPAVEAERRRLEALIAAHDADVADIRKVLTHLVDITGRLDPQDPRHRHPPGDHLHAELHALPGLELGQRTLRNELAALTTRPVPPHPHEDLVTQAEYGGALRSLQTFATRHAEVTSALEQRLTTEQSRLRAQLGQVPAHRHDDLAGAINTRASEVMLLEDQVRELQGWQTQAAQIEQGLVNVGETLGAELETLRQTVAEQATQISGLMGQLAIHQHDETYAALDHTHELITDDDGARGMKHYHAWVLTSTGPGKDLGNQTLYLRCDIPGCGQKMTVEITR